MSVKEKKRGRPARNTNHLSSETIVAQAKVLILDEEKNPSIRKLATSLGVDARAIYYYFKNKDALLEAITTSLVDEIYSPQVSDHWKQELERLCNSYLLLLDRYSGLLETLLSMKCDGPAKLFIDRFTGVIVPLNLSKETTTHALNLLVDYLHGYALAMKCNKLDKPMRTELLKGSLALYCKAIECH